MTLGQQMTELRKKKGLSQANLGKAVDTSGDIIGRYELNEVKTWTQIALKMANLLELSLDYLVVRTSLEFED